MDLPESQTPSPERTLRLVELLLARPDGLTPQELLLELDISRSSLFLLLRTLKNLGYVEQAERRGRYRLGARLQTWQASSSPASKDLLSAFYQATAHQEWSETLALAMPADDGILVLAQAESSAQVRSVYVLGKAYPELSAASPVLSAPPPPEVKHNGYALTANANSLDLALPICPDGVHPQAALLLTAPRYRWQEAALLEAYLAPLRTMAARLSYQAGAPAYTPYRSLAEPQTPATTPLPPAEMSAFLQGPWTARLAVVRPDGQPHVIPVWQEWDGKAFTLIAWKGSQWAEHLLQNPNVSLTIDEPWPPLRRVVVRGQAASLNHGDDIPGLEALVQRLTRRYLGQTNNALSSQVQYAFRLHPDFISGWQGLPASLVGHAGGELT